MAITATALTVEGFNKGRVQWAVGFTSADASGGETIKAGEAGKSHYIEKFALQLAAIGTATLRDGTTALLGPIPFAVQVTAAGEACPAFAVYEFKRPIKITAAAAITVIATAGNIFGIVEGFTI
jgi:hypothetical protein